MGTLGGLLGSLAAVGNTPISGISASWLQAQAESRFGFRLPRVAAMLISAHFAESFGPDVTLASIVQPRLGELLPLASMEVSQLTPEAVKTVASVFNFHVSDEAAAELATRLPALASSSDETIADMVTSGGLKRILTGSKRMLVGDLIRRCTHCGGLLIPQINPKDL